MITRFKVFLMVCVTVLSFFFFSCASPRPPKPGPHFVWVESHTKPGGTFVPGHWKYVGPPQKGRAGIPGHYGPRGRWIPGHWR